MKVALMELPPDNLGSLHLFVSFIPLIVSPTVYFIGAFIK